MPYISAEPRYISERYILVAAIVTMIILGVCGNCVVEKAQDTFIPPLASVANKNSQGPGILVVYRNVFQSTTSFE